MNPYILTFLVVLTTLGAVHYSQKIRRLDETSPLPKISLWQLFAISCIGLYTEMVLIRWIGTEVRVFAYVQNLALIACFLGFGIGCFSSAKPLSLMRLLEHLVFITVLVLVPIPVWKTLLPHLSNMLTLSKETLLWGDFYVYSANMLLFLRICSILFVFWLLWQMVHAMIVVGSWVGYCFGPFR